MKHLIQSPRFNLIPFLLIAILIFAGCERKNPAVELVPAIAKYVDFWNTGNFDGIEEILHPDFELRMTPTFEPEKGIEAFKESITNIRTAYPDFHLTVDELIFAEDAVAARWTITAANTGPGKSPPTGKKVEVSGISIIHFSEGKIADEWIAANNLHWLQQLGYTLTPPPEVKGK